MIRIICILFIALFTSCSSGSVPANLLSPVKMQKVVNDLLQIDEFVNNFVVKDSATNLKTKRSILYEQVFKINKTNRKQFYQSYKYYQQHPDIQKALFDSLYENFNRKKIEANTPAPIKPVDSLKKKIE